MTTLPLEVPFSEETEQAFIGCCLLGAFEEARELGCSEEHFNLELARNAWTAMEGLDEEGSGINQLTVSKAYKGGPLWLDDAVSKAPSASNLSYWWPDLRDYCVRRRVFQQYYDGIQLTQDPNVTVKELADELEARFFKVTSGSSRLKNQKDAWRDLVDLFQQAFPKGLPSVGCKTGLGGVDHILRGFHPGSMNTLAARPGRGKSAFAVQVMVNAAKRGEHVVYYSYEMPFNQVAQRAVSCLSGIDVGHYLETGHVDSLERLTAYTKEANSLPFHVEDAVDKSAFNIRSEARRFVKEHNTSLFIVDYLQLVPPGRRNQNRVVEVSDISRTIKKAAMEVNRPFLVLAQMNRSIESREGEPRLSDLRESGSIEQDSDSVMFLHQPDFNADLTTLLVKKNRHGKEGKAGLRWTKYNGRFETFEEKETETNQSPF